MSSSLTGLRRYLRRLSPTMAEIWFALPEVAQDSGVDLRGRLVGPKCAGISTIEIAHPLQPLAGPPGGIPGLVRRVVIPEPGVWDPERPFLYEGPVELVENGTVRERYTITQGFRACEVRERTLRWNGRPLLLRGQRVADTDASTLRRLKELGCNLLLTTDPGEETLAQCDRLGMLVLAQCQDWQGIGRLQPLSTHAALLGATLPAASAGLALAQLPAEPRFALGIGVEVETVSTKIPAGAAFVKCPAALVDGLPAHLPYLVQGQGADMQKSSLGFVG